MVLDKGFDERGPDLLHQLRQPQGGELEANPRAALLFHWPELGRQVRVEGTVERVAREETEAYARSRARGSQLSALASPQSRPVESREWLESAWRSSSAEHAGTDLPVSEDWGGYRLVPVAWEFWQHRPTACTTASATLADGAADRAPGPEPSSQA